MTVSVPPQQRLQLKEGQILCEHIDIVNIPVHCQPKNPKGKIIPLSPQHYNSSQFSKQGKGMEKVQP
jgi:hypothetical protein